MGYAERPTRPVLTEKLVQQPRRYSFLKAVELTQLASGKGRVGLLSFNDEPFLFRANPSFGFPASDIQDVTQLKNGKYEFVVNFMGLYGPSSPLPDFFTQSIIDEQVEVEAVELTTFYLHSLSELLAYQEQRLDMVIVRKRLSSDIKAIRSQAVKKIVLSQLQVTELQNGLLLDEVLSNEQYNKVAEKSAYVEIHHSPCANQKDFLDVFNHRLITLYLEASRKYHPYQRFNLPQDYHCDILYTLIGAPPPECRDTSPIKWQKLLKFAGLLSLKQGSGETISKVIAGYFSIANSQVSIEENILREVTISEDQLNCLGKMNINLGESFVCGRTVPDRSSKFRLHIDELDEKTFYELLPPVDGSSVTNRHAELKALLDFIKSPEQLADICLHLSHQSEQQMKLERGSPTMLGYSSWLNPSHTQPRHVVI